MKIIKKIGVLLGIFMLSSCGQNNNSNSKNEAKNKIIIESSVTAVTEAINSIGEVNSSSGELINAISDAFVSLSLEDKELVSNYSTLFNAQKKFATLEGIPEVDFDEGNIVRRIGCLADTHNSENIANSFSILNNWDDIGMDTLVIAGDISDGVRYSNTASWEIPKVKNLYGSNVPDNVPIVMCLGNHDDTNASMTAEFYDVLGERFYGIYDDQDSIRNYGCGHCKIGDYHFIVLEDDYDREEITIYAESFLKKTLKEITESPDYNNEYIFIINHLVPFDTCVQSSMAKKLNSILKFYPQAFVVAGHSHHPITDERNIMQTSFTTLNPGSVMWLDANLKSIEAASTGVITSQYNEYTSYNLPMGSLIEIDNKGNMRINRIDFRGEGYLIREPWLISKPQNNNSHLFRYTKDRALSENNPAPYFEETNATCYYTNKNSKFDIEIYFSAAIDNDFIIYYEITLFGAQGQLVKSSFNVLSEYYLYSNTDNIPETKKFKLSGLSEIPTTMKVIAHDTFDATSEEETFTLINISR